MATKRVTRRPVADAKPVEVKTVEETVETPAVAPAKVAEKKKFEASDPIMCRSVTAGYLAMEGLKTHINYIWSNYNDETGVEYQDLVSAVRGSYDQIFKPLFIIEDEDFLREFPQIEKIYGESYGDSDVDEILAMPTAKMVETIKSLPQSIRDSIKSIVADRIKDGSLDSMSKVNALNKALNTDFMILSDM